MIGQHFRAGRRNARQMFQLLSKLRKYDLIKVLPFVRFSRREADHVERVGLFSGRKSMENDLRSFIQIFAQISENFRPQFLAALRNSGDFDWRGLVRGLNMSQDF